MAINKNFAVKHGLEVATSLILANADTRRVGIGSTIPKYTLDVIGGIGVTDIYASGIATIATGIVTNLRGTNLNYTGIGTVTNLYSTVGVINSVYTSGISTVATEFNVGTDGATLTALGTGFVGIGTTNPEYKLDVRSAVSTGQTALYVYGDVRVTGDLNVDDITFDDATVQNLTITDTLYVGGESGIATIGKLGITGLTTTQNLQVTGVSTFVGFSTFQDYVDIQDGLNVLGISTLGVTSATNLTAQQFNVSDISTLGVTSATNLIAQQLNVSGVATASAYYVDGTSVINNSRQLQNIVSLDATTTATIEAAISNAPNTFTDLNVTGITTLGTVQISSGIITATSGIVTYYGDGQYLENVTSGVGLGTTGGIVGYGATVLYFQGPGISTITVSSGIATINITGGGAGSASIGIGTTPGEAFTGIVTAGNLWYNSNIGRLFIYYQDNDSSQWVDASPFNIGINTASDVVSSQWITTTAGIHTLSNVGIGTTNPQYELDVLGDINFTGTFRENGSPFVASRWTSGTGDNIYRLNGNVGIGTTDPTSKLHVDGDVKIIGVATAQDFDALSDINYKENINTVNNALLKIEQMRGVKFNWKESGLPSYGVIAQELQEVLPELVHGDDPKTVNYNGIIGVLIEAIKELKAEIDDLKKQ